MFQFEKSPFLKYITKLQYVKIRSVVNKMLEISVVIPVYNAKKHVKRLLKSLNKNFDFHSGEVILVDDCSKADTAEMLDDFVKEYPHYKLIRNQENKGFPGSCNCGIAASTGKIVILLNSDTLIPADFCKYVTKCFESDPAIGVASPLSSRSCAYWFKKPWFVSLDRMNEKIRSKHECTYPQIPSAEGFCYCIRREVIEQQGGLDEIYGRGYHEEIDFAFRANTNGWKNVLIDDLYVAHNHHTSFGKKTKTEQLRRNDPIFKERWDGFLEKFIEEHQLVDPMPKIKADVFNKK